MTHSGTTARRPAGPGMRRPRAVSAGGGRCWVRTNVGQADGFTDRLALSARMVLTCPYFADDHEGRCPCPPCVRARGHPGTPGHGQARTLSADGDLTARTLRRAPDPASVASCRVSYL